MDCSKRGSVFCCSIDGNNCKNWLRQCTEKFLKRFLIVAGFCYNGKLKKKTVSSKAKINLLYHQQNILEPIFEEEIPTVYGKDVNKVELLMDKVSSHTSNSTTIYLEKKEPETEINLIPFDEISVNSPYASVMDFCTFELLKPASGKWHPRTLNGL
ncbi:uncharacterized protein TNCV_3037871 [Trichonephila clavipes]|nr:uncharacterized protein TNCV_3037871 [Trichonephila clavipes]